MDYRRLWMTVFSLVFLFVYGISVAGPGLAARRKPANSVKVSSSRGGLWRLNFGQRSCLHDPYPKCFKGKDS